MTHLLNCPSPATLNLSVPTILRTCCLPITGVVSRRLPSRSYWVRRLQDWPVRCLHFGGLCKTFNWHTCHHAIKGSVSLRTLNCALISIWILVCCIHRSCCVQSELPTVFNLVSKNEYVYLNCCLAIECMCWYFKHTAAICSRSVPPGHTTHKGFH